MLVQHFGLQMTPAVCMCVAAFYALYFSAYNTVTQNYVEMF